MRSVSEKVNEPVEEEKYFFFYFSRFLAETHPIIKDRLTGEK